MIDMLISEIYNSKPVTLSAQTSVAQALTEMEKHDVNGFLVVNDDKKVVGVLSLQDIAAATVPSQFKKNLGMALAMYKQGFFHEQVQAIQDKPISKIMRRDFISVNLETNIMAIMADFLKNDLYIVPVVEAGKLLGVVTRSQIREALLVGMNLKRKINHAN